MADDEQGTNGWEPPDGWPENFKSPEDLLRSYNELRPEMNRLQTREQELVGLIEEQDRHYQEQMAAMNTPPAQSIGIDDPLALQYQQAAENGDYGAMLRIQAEAAARPMLAAVEQVIDQRFQQVQPAIEAQQAAQREASIRMAEGLVERDLGPERYRELLPAIQSLVADHPEYLPAANSVEGYAQSIIAVAKLAEHATLQTRVQELEAERAEKLAAQTVSGAGRGSVYSQDEQAAMRDRIFKADDRSWSSVARGGS